MRIPPTPSISGPYAIPVTVQKGDNLWNILKRNFKDLTDDREILKALYLVLKKNPSIKDPDKIKVGQEILLPSKATIADLKFEFERKEVLPGILEKILKSKTIPEKIKSVKEEIDKSIRESRSLD